jgi:hypothetical protein
LQFVWCCAAVGCRSLGCWLLRGPLPGLGLAFGLRFSRSPKHATAQPRALPANPRAGSKAHSQISTLQFEVPPSRSSRFTSTSKSINKHQLVPNSPRTCRRASSVSSPYGVRISLHRRIVGTRASTMKELLDTDRVNFLVWRFVIFRCPALQDPPPRIRWRYSICDG